MGKKVFVSYKYLDNQVQTLSQSYPDKTTARHYVDELQDKLEEEDHINKGEDDDEDMGTLADSTIGSKLGDKIFDSSITIVLISKGMKENKPEKEQWIPWEISYSLSQQSREGGRSKTNGVLAVVIPDEKGIYEHFIKENTCPKCNCRTLLTNSLFKILSDNMFNIKNPEFSDCDNHVGYKPYTGYSSYIYSVKWEDFIKNVNKYVEIADYTRQNINQYELVKTFK